jgi:hypothetical protein
MSEIRIASRLCTCEVKVLRPTLPPFPQCLIRQNREHALHIQDASFGVHTCEVNMLPPDASTTPPSAPAAPGSDVAGAPRPKTPDKSEAALDAAPDAAERTALFTVAPTARDSAVGMSSPRRNADATAPAPALPARAIAPENVGAAARAAFGGRPRARGGPAARGGAAGGLLA